MQYCGMGKTLEKKKSDKQSAASLKLFMFRYLEVMVQFEDQLNYTIKV